jgi:hypothetical protein
MTDILKYLDDLKGMILALVDFAFIPDDRPPRTVYEGHYLILISTGYDEEGNRMISYLDPVEVGI